MGWRGPRRPGRAAPAVRLGQRGVPGGSGEDRALLEDTGIDGMIIDAVNWYVDHTWALGRRRMTDVIASYDNSYSQPEGAGGFREDPAAWITEGGWNSVQDYGLGIWWESGSDVIRNAIETGDPRPIERALRDYH